MKKLFTLTAVLLAATMFVPAFAQKKEKKKKEKKPFEWVMPELSGNATVDTFLLECDTVWNNTLHISESLNAYHIDTAYVKADDGEVYRAISIVDKEGNKRSFWGVVQQNAERLLVATNLVLTTTNLALSTATATLALPDLGLKALSYGKYIKQGGQLIGRCGVEAKNFVDVIRAQNRELSKVRKGAVDVGEIKSTDQVVLNRMEAGEEIPEGASVNPLADLDMGEGELGDLDDLLKDSDSI